LSQLSFAVAALLLKINFNQNKMPKATDQYNLSVMNPALAKEWHPSRNGDLNPRNVTPGSGKKVWWICISGHEWQAPVYSRNRGSGCPVCNKPTPADNNERLITSSDLRKEWHLTRNSGLNLRNLPPGFSEKVWWICEEGHEWQATVKSRTRGRGCPDCNEDLSRKDSSRKHKIPLGAQRQPDLERINVFCTGLRSSLKTQIPVPGVMRKPKISAMKACCWNQKWPLNREHQ
jgi:hypothetical protein